MASADHLVGLDLEDLTPRQLRQLLRAAARKSAMRHERADEGESDGKDKDKEDDENSKLVDLKEEKKGKSKSPKVTKNDLPEGVEEE